MRNYQLDAAEAHAEGDRTDPFLGAVLAKLDEPLACEVLPLSLAQPRLSCPQHFLHAGDMQIDQVAERGRILEG